MKPPCLNCTARTAECHAVCEQYKEYAKVQEKNRNERYKVRLVENLARSAKRDGCEKTMRRHKK